MTIVQRIEEPTDQFPVGMRVLAVDDDPTCLILLEKLLRKCKYHVTTRTNAIAALNLLRENKNQFDLVISDVHMPDMDGFKLLELVGLEMDLPVIMLSANGDQKLVMKGITHGACDYLLKPVRIEELQIIWQHVIRKKKVEPKTPENCHNGSTEGGQGGVGNGNCDQKSNKKRKDQVEDEDEDRDENGIDNDDPSAQKKPRVVWSIELHRKFVAAVNHLGIDKAVPKRILELMNVEKLTRENVASHLQKYRLYLRRISCVQSQQANMVAAFGNTDPTSFMRISSLNGMGSFNALSGSPQFQNATFNSFQHNSMLGRLSSPASLGVQQLPSPVQVNHSQLSGFSGHASDRSITSSIPGNLNGRILKGTPMSFEFDQLQDNTNRSISRIGEVIPKVDELTCFQVSSGLPDAKGSLRSFNSSHLTISNNSKVFQGHTARANSQIGIHNQSSTELPSLGPGISSHFLDRTRGDDHWPFDVQLSAVLSSSYAPYHGTQHINTILDNGSSNDMPLSVSDYQYQATHSADIGHALSGQVTINNPRVANAVGIPEFNSVDQPHYVDRQVENLAANIPLSNSKQWYQIGNGNGKPQVYQPPNNVGSLEELVSSMMK